MPNEMHRRIDHQSEYLHFSSPPHKKDSAEFFVLTLFLPGIKTSWGPEFILSLAKVWFSSKVAT